MKLQNYKLGSRVFLLELSEVQSCRYCTFLFLLYYHRITFSADEDLSYKDISSSESNLQGILEEFLPQGKQSSDLPTMTNADKPNQSIEKSGVQCQTVKTTAQDSGIENIIY